MKINKLVKYKAPRPNAVKVMLSDRELAAIDEYCRMTGAKSRAEVVREGAVRFAMAKIIDEKSRLFKADGQNEAETPAARRPEYAASLFAAEEEEGKDL